MNRVFKPFLDRFVIIFIDNLLVYSWSNEEYEEHLMEVLQILRERKIFTKLKKYEFGLRKVVFLGEGIFKIGVLVDPKKVKAIKGWP